MKRIKNLGVFLIIALCLVGCNKKETPQSVDEELVNKVRKICNAEYDFTSDNEIERQLANCIESVNIGQMITVTITPYVKVEKLDIYIGDLKQAYLLGEITDSELKSSLEKIYSNVRSENCFQKSSETKQVIVSDIDLLIPRLLEESNILGNLKFYEDYIKYEMRLMLSE